MARVSRNASLVSHQTDPRRTCTSTNEELLTAHWYKKGDGKTLVGVLLVQKLLQYAPMLRWYVEHGAVIKTAHRTIDYQVVKIFIWFVEQVTETRRTGNVDKSKAVPAEVFKLLGNSGYGKPIEVLERQTSVSYPVG